MSAICPTCRKPGGIQLFTSVAPCERCEPPKKTVDGGNRVTSKLPANWTRARWVDLTTGHKNKWVDREKIEQIAAGDTVRKGTWGQVVDGNLTYRSPYDGHEWTVEVE